MILQETLTLKSGFKRVHQKTFMKGIKHGLSGMIGASSTSSTFSASDSSSLKTL